jgi:hypothetical protein
MGVSPLSRSRIGIIGLSAAAVIMLSSCSWVTQDAARVGKDTLSNGDFHELLEGYTDATQSGLLPTGNVDSNVGRLILRDWISAAVLERTLVEYGVEISPTDLEGAQASLDAQVGFAEAPEVVRNFYIRATAVRAVAGSTFTPDREELAELYANGPEESGIACLRLILTDSQEAIDSALARIEFGESFADVARDVSTDTSAQNGGILTNNQTGDECFPFDEIVQQIVEEIALVIPETRPGEVSGPIEVPEVGWVAVFLRPFSEVADEAERVVGPVTASRIANSALDSAEIWINPGYGRWDPDSRQVVAGQ